MVLSEFFKHIEEPESTTKKELMQSNISSALSMKEYYLNSYNKGDISLEEFTSNMTINEERLHYLKRPHNLNSFEYGFKALTSLEDKHEYIRAFIIYSKEYDYLYDYANTLMYAAKFYKKMIKEDNNYYPIQITILEECVDIYNHVKKAYIERTYSISGYRDDYHEPTYTYYEAFRELAIAYERTGQLKKAIEVSELAIRTGITDNTSFDRRIAKLKRKLGVVRKTSRL